jgi:hypothetical protein
MREEVHRMGGPALDRLFRADFEDARLACESRRGGDEGVTRRCSIYRGIACEAFTPRPVIASRNFLRALSAISVLIEASRSIACQAAATSQSMADGSDSLP